MFSTCCYFCWFSDPPWHPAGAEWDENGANNWSVGLFFDTMSTHAAKKNTTHNTTNLFFVTLAPKPDFHLHCDQPQHEIHNLQHTPSEWICCCFGIIFWIDVCECFFFTLHKVLTRSAKIKQDQPKDRQAQTCKRHLQKQVMKRRAPKMRGGGVTPHGVFNNILRTWPLRTQLET